MYQRTTTRGASTIQSSVGLRIFSRAGSLTLRVMINPMKIRTSLQGNDGRSTTPRVWELSVSAGPCLIHQVVCQMAVLCGCGLIASPRWISVLLSITSCSLVRDRVGPSSLPTHQWGHLVTLHFPFGAALLAMNKALFDFRP